MDYLKDLNPKQREAVETLDGVVMISAGAGSGKTKVLTCRIARLIENGIAPFHILGITFTNKAAKEMKSRLNNMVGENNVTLKTFHSLCVTMLKREELDDYDKNWTIYDTSKCKTLMKKILKELHSDFKEDQILGEISKIKEKGFTPKQYDYYLNNTELEDATKRHKRNVSEIYHIYQRQLLENNAMDFDDLLLNTVEMLKNSEDIRKRYQRHYRYILVDEYQDTNRIQYELIKLLFSGNLCVVGDADQSIYGWRGAEESNMTDFPKDFPDYKLILLEQNYRSTSVILDAANAVIANNEGRIVKNLWTDKSGGDPVFYRTLSDGVDEGNYIADCIRRLHNVGTNYRDIAVLYRMNRQSRQIEESLINAGIPYMVLGGVRFYERKDIKDILAYLNTFTNSADSLSLMRVINYPARGLGKKVIESATAFSRFMKISFADALQSDDLPIPEKKKETIRKFFETLWSCADAKDITGFVENIIKNFKIREQIIKETENKKDDERIERFEILDEFLAFTKQFMEDDTTEHGLDDFLNRIALYSDADAENRMDGVSLMTVHAAKGLEFPVVFLPGLENGIFPTYNVLNETDLDTALREERRLMYVAITRAKDLLFISNAEERMGFNGMEANPPSLFLHEIPPELLR